MRLEAAKTATNSKGNRGAAGNWETGSKGRRARAMCTVHGGNCRCATATPRLPASAECCRSDGGRDDDGRAEWRPVEMNDIVERWKRGRMEMGGEIWGTTRERRLPSYLGRVQF